MPSRGAATTAVTSVPERSAAAPTEPASMPRLSSFLRGGRAATAAAAATPPLLRCTARRAMSSAAALPSTVGFVGVGNMGGRKQTRRNPHRSLISPGRLL